MKNITEATVMLAIESPLPFPLRLFALANPIPPKTQPNIGTKNEQTNPATAIPFPALLGVNDIRSSFSVLTPQFVQITASGCNSFPQLQQNVIKFLLRYDTIIIMPIYWIVKRFLPTYWNYIYFIQYIG